MSNLKILLQLRELEFGRAKSSTRKKSQSKAKIARLRQQLDSGILQYYDMVKERYRDNAVAEITNGACSGCFIMLPRCNLKHLDDNIYVCEHCNRILYDPDLVAASEFIFT